MMHYVMQSICSAPMHMDLHVIVGRIRYVSSYGMDVDSRQGQTLFLARGDMNITL